MQTVVAMLKLYIANLVLDSSNNYCVVLIAKIVNANSAIKVWNSLSSDTVP